MSEYQYYEFQAIDRPLTDDEQKSLRALFRAREDTRNAVREQLLLRGLQG